MSICDPVSILAVCVGNGQLPVMGEEATLITADGARTAIEMMRMLKFDLLLTGTVLPDMPLLQFVSRVKAAWPWQKWALVAGNLSPREEVIIRTLGVTRIFDQQIEPEALVKLGERLTARREISGTVRTSQAAAQAS